MLQSTPEDDSVVSLFYIAPIFGFLLLGFFSCGWDGEGTVKYLFLTCS